MKLGRAGSSGCGTPSAHLTIVCMSRAAHGGGTKIREGNPFMRQIDHFIAGGTDGLTAVRKAPVYDPNSGAVQAEVVLGGQDALDRAVAAAQAAQPACLQQRGVHRPGP